MIGKIKKMMMDKGFGFISPVEGREDLFFHFSWVVGKVDVYNTLTEGQTVSFDVQQGQKGPMAVNVTPSDEAANDADFGGADFDMAA